jgi:MFS family permease
MEKVESKMYKWYVVVLLMIAYICSFVDRYIMNLLVEPMKKDMGITDTQVSLLIGASFAMFYATLGLPIGRMADKYNRKNIITIGIIFWSVMTTVCGLAKNYFQLFLARIGVGVGEASLSPSAYSLIADYFPKKRLATALSIYSIGIYLGVGGAYIIGGKILTEVKDLGMIQLAWGIEIFAWQLVFFYVGLPGLLIAIFIFLIKEPQRKIIDIRFISLNEVFIYLRQNGKTFGLFCMASACFFITSYAAGVWAPTFLIRIHQMPVGEVGNFIGLTSMLAAPVGLLAGGALADYWTAKGIVGAKIRVCLLVSLLWLPFNLAYTTASTLTITLIILVPYYIISSASIGVGAAVVQEIMPTNMRSTASAIYLFCQNLVGLGVGPASVGLLNDYVFGSPMAVGKSLMIVPIFSLLGGAFFYYLTLKNYKKEHKTA